MKKWALNTASHFKASVSHFGLSSPLRPVQQVSIAAPAISVLKCSKAQIKMLVEHSGNKLFQLKHKITFGKCTDWIKYFRDMDGLSSHFLTDFLTSCANVCVG